MREAEIVYLFIKEYKTAIESGKQSIKKKKMREVCQDSCYSKRGKVTALRRRQRPEALVTGSQWTESDNQGTAGHTEAEHRAPPAERTAGNTSGPGDSMHVVLRGRLSVGVKERATAKTDKRVRVCKGIRGMYSM